MALSHLLARSPSIVDGVHKAKTTRQLVSEAAERDSISEDPSASMSRVANVDSSVMVAKFKSRIKGNNVMRSRRREEEELLLCFKVMDEDGDGCLSVDELHDAYQYAGADVSRATLASLVKLLHKSKAGKGDKSQGAGAKEELDEGYSDSLTYNDFKALTKLRKQAKWDDNAVSGEKLSCISDLPIPISLVAFSQRRKIILRNYLMDDFDIPERFLTDVDQTRMAASHAGISIGPLGNSLPAASLAEADDSTLQQHALSLLPPSMQKKAVHELSMIPDKIQHQRRHQHRPPAAQPPRSSPQQHSSGAVSPPRRIRGLSPFEVRHGPHSPQTQQPHAPPHLDNGNHGAESTHICWSSADAGPPSPGSSRYQYNEGPYAIRHQPTAGDRHLGTSVAKVSPASPMLPPSSPVRLSRHRRWLPSPQQPSSPRFRSRGARSVSGVPSASRSFSDQQPLTDYFTSVLVQGPIVAHSSPTTPTPAMLLSSAPNYLAASYQPRPSRATPAASSVRGSGSQSRNQSRKQKVRMAQDAAKVANGKAIMKGWRNRSLSNR